MKEIKNIYEMIADEIEGAEKYAKEAIRWHGIDPEKGATYLDMSKQELSHIDRLHAIIVKEIKKQKDSGAEIPKGMQEIYDWQHEKMIDEVARIKNLQMLYK